MASRLRPGCLVRSTLALFGVLFLPLAIWFAHSNWRRYWFHSAGLALVGAVFLWLALGRSPFIDALDQASGGGPANPDAP